MGIFNANNLKVYDVISQTQKYHQFIPWCEKSIIKKQVSQNQNYTELIINFANFKSLSYVSHVTLSPFTEQNKCSSIISICKESPLRFLKSEWIIRPNQSQRSHVKYNLQFDFINPLYQFASSTFIDHLGIQMWNIFEKQTSKKTHKRTQTQDSVISEGSNENNLDKFLEKNQEILNSFQNNPKFRKEVLSLHERLKSTQNYELKMLHEIKSLMLYI